MIALSPQQQRAGDHKGDVLVTACPGSGKTRVLTYRVMKGLAELSSSKHRVVAMTFTNRATDELQHRLDRLAIDTAQLWAGTIHSFALEWIVRPYAPYENELRRGFTIADEFVTDRLLRDLREEFGQPAYFDVNTALDRDGQLLNEETVANDIAQEYKERLRAAKLVDYDDILYYAYRILTSNEEIPHTLNRIIRLFCVDEIQDTQDLQYGILSAICRAAAEPPTLFFVGDLDQSIYESLGTIPKTAEEIAAEFGLDHVQTLPLTGNYRSTQRLIDFYQGFRPTNQRIESLTMYRRDPGRITFHDHSIAKDDLGEMIATLIQEAVDHNVPAGGICVLAPQWWHVQTLGRSLITRLPQVPFDAPGLSPLHTQRDNVWFKLARIFLTVPTPQLYNTRLRWAGELIADFENGHGVGLPDTIRTARKLLRLTNAIRSVERDGMGFLRETFLTFAEAAKIDLGIHTVLAKSQQSFFAKAQDRLDNLGEEAPADVDSFRRLFRHPAGVVIGTCHSVKGEEYDTVIAFGLLRGYIPNWRDIIHGRPGVANDRASKLLYVIASRAKRRLHLIAEAGRFTQSGIEYQTSEPLASIEFTYDN